MTVLSVMYLFLCIGGTFAKKVLPEKDASGEHTLLSSTTEGKLSGVLRNILNQESLVRFSMAQKFQKLVLDVLDNQHNSKSLLRKVGNIAKELQALETRDQILEEENFKLKQELKVMYDNQSHITEQFQRLDEFDIRLKMVEEKMINLSAQQTADTGKRVYFSAGITKEIRNSAVWNGNDVIIFYDVISNEGGAYNASTGVFTAPVDGVYVFSCFILTDRTTFYAYLEVNGSRKINVLGNTGPSRYDILESAGNLDILHLQQGDRVLMRRSSGSNIRSVHDAPSTTFSGFLLY
ncbi:heavy metal-binding protein HIP-like [Saccostrea echinata]|uniref:heavy metal-binding protein HIP-like n=1 Tax=Saccostrea echinata TaxID=191078 RepID=UPI002A80A011|nr:heavy metal-binding protein HIP-like [Saccostrea echinata]